jgi:hypothetical protein
VTDEDDAGSGIEEASALAASISALTVLLKYDEPFRNEFRKALEANDIEGQNALVRRIGLKYDAERCFYLFWGFCVGYKPITLPIDDL